MPQAVLIAGHYGFTNTGDEAILIAMISHLREMHPDIRFTVTSGMPETTARAYGVDAVSWTDLPALHDRVSRADLVIVGGGGLFHDYWPVAASTVLTENHSGLSFFSGIVLMASFYRRPVMLYAVGVGPLFSEQGKTFTQFACEAAAAITVRDSGSKQVLASIGVPESHVIVTADPAFALPDCKDEELVGFVRELKTRGPVISVAPRAWNIGVDQPAWEREFAAGLDRFLRERAGTVLFIPFQRVERPGEDDTEAASHILSLMQFQDRASILTRKLAPQQIQTVIGESDLVIGMRLHSTIFAMKAGVPVVALSYDPKVGQTMERAGLSDFTINIGSLEASCLANTMNRALTENRPVPTEVYASRALENARIAAQILDQARDGLAVERVEVRWLRTGLEQHRRESLIRTQEAQAAAAKIVELNGELAGLKDELNGERAVQRDLTASISSLKVQLTQERKQLKDADDLRKRALRGLDQFHHRLNALIDSYRSQRAWTVMIAIRKAYTLFTRRGPFALIKWTVGLPFRGAGDLHPHDLNFPNVWDFLPEGLKGHVEVRAAQTADSLPRRKYDIVIFAIFDFEFRFQRPQQIAVQFARLGHRVFWISPSRFLTDSADAPYETLHLKENVWEVHLRGTPPDLYGGRMTANDAAGYTESLAQLYRDFDIAESCCLLQFPYWRQAALAVRKKSGAKLVYDCMDDWQNWTAEPRINQFNLDEERRLASECDVLLASSNELWDRHRAVGLDPLLVRNGADFDFFASEMCSPSAASIPKPVIGYYGAIANWFDLDLITRVAHQRPNYNFVLIGQVHEVDVSRLEALPNVLLLGEKNYREIPRYLSTFDVALIPFKVNRLTGAVDPVKLYEYFSQGKPVVATDMAELRRAGHLIYAASGPDEFAAKIDLALNETGVALRNERVDFARANTWAARVEEIDRAVSVRYPLVSILIVTYNCREFIGPCLDSLDRNTSWPNYEVIVMDNNSTDGSGEVADQHAASDRRIRVIRGSANLGFAGANNLAAGAAKGEYILFLNPDTLVTPGWIGRLIRHFESSPPIGAVAAVTNFSGNETKINFDYGDLLGMEKFARKLTAREMGQTREIEVAPLYCVLVPKSVWDAVGGLDTQFEIGMFEDDDFSLRVKKAGYRVVAAEDCFIHHFGNGSFAKLPSGESLQLFERNKRRFETKWNLAWRQHTLRPGVRSPHDEIRFTPGEFVQIDASALQQGPEPTVLRRLHPASTTAGRVFNRQSDGGAALVVECANATPGTVIVMGTAMLATSYGNPNLLSAIVPSSLFAKPGRHRVHLSNDFGPSNQMDFDVTAPD